MKVQCFCPLITWTSGGFFLNFIKNLNIIDRSFLLLWIRNESSKTTHTSGTTCQGDHEGVMQTSGSSLLSGTNILQENRLIFSLTCNFRQTRCFFLPFKGMCHNTAHTPYMYNFDWHWEVHRLLEFFKPMEMLWLSMISCPG